MIHVTSLLFVSSDDSQSTPQQLADINTMSLCHHTMPLIQRLKATDHSGHGHDAHELDDVGLFLLMRMLMVMILLMLIIFDNQFGLIIRYMISTCQYKYTCIYIYT